MLELRGISKAYSIGGQTVQALDSVDLTFEAGTFSAIVGPSGAGKSTLLHILGALDTPDSGSVTFQGQDIQSFGDNQLSEFRRHKVGFVFQFFNLLPTMSAWENVALPMLLDGGTFRAAKPRALELLELVDLQNRADHRPSQMSGGQMQRVAVARALMMDAPLILADEPSGNLDSKAGAQLMSLLARIAHEDSGGRAVVTVTHNVAAAAATDRVVTLQDGGIRSDTARVS
ncbi:putative ABC transport system ATP-binding protein [Rhodococcus sp. 27YEA15]|uniref:ABC transporter ATP-binding protein n=1 Tax=Rhodococcus sp. 27YEA15 TaxID=3156259 RepID=UPI003C7CFA66